MSCGCRVRVAGDIDALIHVPQSIPDAATDLTATNWLSGVPAVSGAFSNNQGDPTSVIVGSDYSAIVGGESNTVDASNHSFIGGGEDNIIDPSRAAAIIGGEGNRVTDHICSGIFVGGTTGAFPFGPNVIDSAAPGPDPTGFSAIIAGASNAVTGTAQAAVIAGGLANSISGGEVGGILAGLANSVTSQGGAVVGGQFNLVSATRGSIVGGDTNIVSAPLAEDSAIVAGTGNVVDISQSFIGGGGLNMIVTGDPFNERNGIIAGLGNLILDGDEHFIGGGKRNEIRQTAAGAPFGDLDSNGIIGAQFCAIDTGESNAIVGGERNLIDGSLNVTAILYSVIAGGADNTVTGPLSGIVAGRDNSVSSIDSFIGGGRDGTVSGGFASGVVAGLGNDVQIQMSGIFAGQTNEIRSISGDGDTEYANVILGGATNLIDSGPLQDAFSSGILAGEGNTILSAARSVIAGGVFHNVNAPDSFVGGGFDHLVPSFAENAAIIGGDRQGFFDADGGGASGARDMVIVGGSRNFVGDGQSGIIAGTFGTVEKSNSVIAGGFGNYIAQQGAAGDSDFIGGGQSNVIDGAGDANAMIGGIFSDITELPGSGGLNHNAIVGGEFNLIDSASAIGGGHRDSVIVGGEGNRISDALRSVILGGTGSVVTDDDSVALGSASAIVGTPRTLAHGLGPADAVGFRGAAPIPAPALGGFLPTGIPGLDATITALIAQGLAV